jgi:hypothetical protein
LKKLFLLLILLIAPALSAQTWAQIRSDSGPTPPKFPSATPITGTYTGCATALSGGSCTGGDTQYVVPTPLFGQQPAWYDQLDEMIMEPLEDAYCGACEWENALFGYSPAADTGASSGAGTGWTLFNDSLNVQAGGNGSVVGSQMVSAVHSGTTATITVTNTGARYIPAKCATSTMPVQDGCYFLMQDFTDAALNIQAAVVPGTSCTACANPNYEPQYISFSYTVGSGSSCQGAGCTPPSSFTSGTSYVIGPSESSLQPYRRHSEGCAFDTTRDAMWCLTGIGDVESLPCIVSGSTCTSGTGILYPHTGVYDLYEWTECTPSGMGACAVSGCVSGQKCWQAAAICGFTTGTYCATPGTAPVATPSPATTGDWGIACPATNSSNCGIKFPFIGYDPTDDVIVMFGGQWNSSIQKETLLYYPAGTTLSTDACTRPCWWGLGSSVTAPSKRWAQGDSRMPSLGTSSHQLLLFGGENGAAPCGTCYNDTWVFDTTARTWTQVISPGCTTSCSGSPPANLNPVMDYDANLGTVGEVVHIDNQNTAHTWFFDPAHNSWTDKGNSGSPNLYQCAGSNCAILYYNATGAYDVATNSFVVFIKVAGAAEAQIWTLNP